MYILFLATMLLLTGAGMLSAAPALFLQHPQAVTALLMILGLAFPLRSVIYLILIWRRKGRMNAVMLVLSAIEALAGIAIIFLPRFSQMAFFVVLELYLSFICAVKATDAYIYRKTRQWCSFVPALVTAILVFQTFIYLLTAPSGLRQQTVAYAAGALLTVFGTGQLCDFLGVVVKSRRFRRVLSSIRLALPDYIGLFLPLRTVSTLKTQPLAPQENTNDVEVLFQVDERGIGLAGHCELCIDGQTMTYGCYEPSSRRLFGTVGGGVIFRAPREKYLDWCIRENQKKVISYTLRFDDEQMAQVRQQLSYLEAMCQPWEPQISPKEYVSRLQKLETVRFYRVTQGPFATYFIPTINCVTITNSLLEKTEIGKALMIGVKTPGAYMALLDRQYYAGNGAVVDRKVYDRGLQQPAAQIYKTRPA